MKHAFLYFCIFGISYLAFTASLTKSTQIDCHTYNIQAACEELARK
tara:strand:+ start:503 stop:640 length:138 start_codon:yes stop_codon:yes gene_type:complete